MTSQPLVSFCLPTYGRARFIGRTLSSVLAQTVRDFEVIVVDDCSPDDTRAVVANFDDPRLTYIRNDMNQGVPGNLDRAMRLGRGQFLVLLEDHDLLAPTYLEATLAVANRYPSVAVVSTDIVTVDDDDRPVDIYRNQFEERTPGRVLLRRLLTRHDCPFSVTTLVRASALDGLEPLFDRRYGWYADQYLWLRVFTRGDLGYVRQPLLYFRLRESDHVLQEREWDSLFMIDRIRSENWTLLHPNGGAKSALDWSAFLWAKLRQVLMQRMRRRVVGPPWSVEDDVNLRRYLPPWFRLGTTIPDALPLWVIKALRDRNRRRYRLDESFTKEMLAVTRPH
jgi:glycosyltransferase involved in cell wall biosynthesis